jgi:hypothetical protein
MEALNASVKYLVLVDQDSVSPDGVAEKLKEAGIEAVVLGIPTLRDVIQFYAILGGTAK